MCAWRGYGRHLNPSLEARYGRRDRPDRRRAWRNGGVARAEPAARQFCGSAGGDVRYRAHRVPVSRQRHRSGGLVDRDYMPYLLHATHGGLPVPSTTSGTSCCRPKWPRADAFFTGTLALDRAHGAVLTPLHAVCADAAMARIAMAATSAAFPCQTVYSIDYIAPVLQPSDRTRLLSPARPAWYDKHSADCV